ncbi:MAG: NAD(P)-binding domain-containing protein [Thermoproteota archaeon]|nr:NAD(P)-binding domain-containing protein [Thermoproteota archaeon]
MKIGILGSGDVGRRLADGFIELGNTIKIGSRKPSQEKITEWLTKHGVEGARLLEPLALLWITYYFRTNNGSHAFKLLRK